MFYTQYRKVLGCKTHLKSRLLAPFRNHLTAGCWSVAYVHLVADHAAHLGAAFDTMRGAFHCVPRVASRVVEEEGSGVVGTAVGRTAYNEDAVSVPASAIKHQAMHCTRTLVSHVQHQC